MGASCLLPKQQSTGAPGQGRGRGRCATCLNCPNDNQPQRLGWRRTTVWGGGQRWDGIPCRSVIPPCGEAVPVGGAAPQSSWRRRPPRMRYWSCTAETWQRRALCVLDSVEGYGERSSLAGGRRWRGSGNTGGSDGVGGDDKDDDDDNIGGAPSTRN